MTVSRASLSVLKHLPHHYLLSSISPNSPHLRASIATRACVQAAANLNNSSPKTRRISVTSLLATFRSPLFHARFSAASIGVAAAAGAQRRQHVGAALANLLDERTRSVAHF